MADLGLPPLPPDQAGQLALHFDLLIRWNRRLNLTRITDPDEAARLHYAESLLAGRFLGDAKSVLDIGSGAGFPAIPLAVVFPKVEVTALEANNKKVVFLKEAKDALGLHNLNVLCRRVEDVDLSVYELLASRALDGAEHLYPEILSRLTSGKSIILFCSPDLLASLTSLPECKVAVNSLQIPGSRSRLVVDMTKES